MSKKIIFETQAMFTAEAGTKNPNLGWLEFILTDNQPNKNKQGIKAEHFKSLVDTGMFMPIKMAKGAILPDHSDASPLGPIIELAASDTVVSGKAVIWKDERPDDYTVLKSHSAAGELINISWEVAYMASNEEDGIEWLVDPILTAATIVGLPAYGGRTPILSVASETNPAEESNLTEDTVEELEQLQSKVTALEAEKQTMEAELTQLREFKQNIEAEKAEAAKLQTCLDKFAEAKLEFTPEEVNENKTVWLGLDAKALDYFIETLKKAKTTNTNASVVPDVSGTQKTNLEIVREGLKELRNK